MTIITTFDCNNTVKSKQQFCTIQDLYLYPKQIQLMDIWDKDNNT